MNINQLVKIIKKLNNSDSTVHDIVQTYNELVPFIDMDRKSDDGQRYLIVHNIGGGQVLADCLFSFKIIGHYTYGR